MEINILKKHKKYVFIWVIYGLVYGIIIGSFFGYLILGSFTGAIFSIGLFLIKEVMEL